MGNKIIQTLESGHINKFRTVPTPQIKVKCKSICFEYLTMPKVIWIRHHDLGIAKKSLTSHTKYHNGQMTSENLGKTALKTTRWMNRVSI